MIRQTRGSRLLQNPDMHLPDTSTWIGNSYASRHAQIRQRYPGIIQTALGSRTLQRLNRSRQIDPPRMCSRLEHGSSSLDLCVDRGRILLFVLITLLPDTIFPENHDTLNLTG